MEVKKVTLQMLPVTLTSETAAVRIMSPNTKPFMSKWLRMDKHSGCLDESDYSIGWGGMGTNLKKESLG